MVPKFRAWDKKYKMIMTVNEIDFEKNTVWLEADQGDHETRHTLTRCFDDVIFMQSTGLKDKNGVEVFQGDIVRCTRGCPHEVVWLQEYAGVYIGGMPAWYLSGLQEGYAWTGSEEIIGSIYTNPELLEVSE
ncbi:YopX family protein [Enterococcus songbeiensis]|uniref:YopX family protein n=1 Tax=Enterococcus songbeiensis TaxID=2559927 RepID=UPI0010F9F005|nr:YopX family protein [Enterococcus songbeiensis]